MRLAGFITLFWAALCLTPIAQADVIDGTSCDVNFMNVVKDRAWASGKREMEVAQTLILKPDSVLEYSCFNVQLSRVENSGWINSDSAAITPANTGGYLDNLVRNPMNAYLSANFGYPEPGGFNAPSSSTLCGKMNDVYRYVQCGAMDVNAFASLQDIRDGDPRSLPSGYSCSQSGGEPDRAANWNENWAVGFPAPGATGGMNTLGFTAPSLLTPSNAPVSDMLKPNNCEDIEPIPTGVRLVNVAGAELYDEKVCPAPGCYYAPPSGLGGNGECRATP